MVSDSPQLERKGEGRYYTCQTKNRRNGPAILGSKEHPPNPLKGRRKTYLRLLVPFLRNRRVMFYEKSSKTMLSCGSRSPRLSRRVWRTDAPVEDVRLLGTVGDQSKSERWTPHTLRLWSVPDRFVPVKQNNDERTLRKVPCFRGGLSLVYGGRLISTRRV